MQLDFHYYATYCAAYIAGFSHEESLEIAYSDQFTDCCTNTLLAKLKAPLSAATTQLQSELMQVKPSVPGLQDVTRIWASFHFLPYDLYAEVGKRPKRYKDKYRLICDVNGPLVADTVKLAKDQGTQAIGIAMHVLADTWAHRYFAGTPSLVINNTNYYFDEIVYGEDGPFERRVTFTHNPAAPDDIEKGIYINSLYQGDENNIMNLGHGRAGHLPDYSFARYRYLPAWGEYGIIEKDNPSDYLHAFCQMIYAMKYLKGLQDDFATETYDFEAIAEWRDEIEAILNKRQLNSEADWRAFAEKLSGQTIPDFDIQKYQDPYRNASKEEKDDTFLGRYFIAAMAQKSMVTGKIYKSKNRLAGVSVDYKGGRVAGMKDFHHMIAARKKEGKKDE